MNSSKFETDYELMISLAQHCARSRDYFNSAEFGEDLASRVAEEYNDIKTRELASPRPTRIEA